MFLSYHAYYLVNQSTNLEYNIKLMVINNNCYIIRVYDFLLYFTREDLPMRKKIVIIRGGVAGGASATARLRRLDENLEIIILEKGDYISFANCGFTLLHWQCYINRDSLFYKHQLC